MQENIKAIRVVERWVEGRQDGRNGEIDKGWKDEDKDEER